MAAPVTTKYTAVSSARAGSVANVASLLVCSTVAVSSAIVLPLAQVEDVSTTNRENPKSVLSIKVASAAMTTVLPSTSMVVWVRPP